MSRAFGWPQWPPSETALAVGLALLGAVISLVISTQFFPYHSVNHDEAVYLQQAAMLVEGKLFLHPPVPEAFRPWFFERDGARLYPKYSPVPAAMFALGELVGAYRIALAAIAAATVGLTYAVVAEVFDRRRGLLAATLLLASPLFLIHSGVFLSYLPTTALNLLFAFGYLRADRTGSRRWAAVAGVATGLAFFARPFTAVLFAAPFVVHALWALRRANRSTLLLRGLTAIGGLAGVAAALAYNAIVTGSPLLFPYEAFAPSDGLGFGRRALLGYSVEYTPGLALRANAEVLWVFFAEWVVAGPIGTALAAVGIGAVLLRIRRTTGSKDSRRLLLVGVLVSVAFGNLYFWGNLNVLGQLSDPTDGLISYVGPHYHVDLLLPTVAFAAHGVVVAATRVRGAVFERVRPARARQVWLATLLLSVAVVGGTSVVTAYDPIQDNRAATEQLARAYEPFEERGLEDALVFLPTPYGDWLNHPFQTRRNDPGYDDAVLYAVEERPFAVAAAFPDRTLYRYSYRGQWSPTTGDRVAPTIRRIRVVEGDRLQLRTSLGVPEHAESVSIRLNSEDGSTYYATNATGRRLDLRLLVQDRRARLDGAVTPMGNVSIPVGATDEIILEAFVEYAGGGGVTYRIRLPVESGTGETAAVRAISPHLEACLEPLRCGGEATYVPGETPPDVFVEARLSANETA